MTFEQRTIQMLGAYQWQILKMATELEILRTRVQELEAKQAQPEATRKD